jgi:hypothetical protein
MPTYTAWPTVADVQQLLDACAIDLRLAAEDQSAYITRKIASVVDETGKRTKRQFLAGATGEERRYDGTGLPELHVDEMLDLEGVSVLSYDGDSESAIDSMELCEDQYQANTRIVSRTGYIFPAGRRNILVTGQFGYASEIPKDLWEAVAQETAFRLASEVGYRPIGRVAELKVGDSTTKYRDDKPWMTGWNQSYKAALQRYRRRGGMRSARLSPPMV